MRTADKIKTGVTNHFYIAIKSAVGHGIAPAGMILMDVGAFEIIVLTIQKESLVGREFEPAKSQRRCKVIHGT